jgi:hypothetical protein
MNMMATDRGMTMPAGMGMTSMMPMGMGPMMASPMAGMGAMGMMMPRCRMTFEKMANGMKMTCMCDDKAQAAMLQSLCMMMQGGMCTCCMMMNGTMCCCCNMSMGVCRMEMTDMGVSMTCTSGDQHMMKMMHANCDCMNAMMMPGMTCCMMMNGMPVCCMMM